MAKEAKQPTEMTKAISVKLPLDLLDKARDKSAATGVPISFVVRKALEEWIKKRD